MGKVNQEHPTVFVPLTGSYRSFKNANYVWSRPHLICCLGQHGVDFLPQKPPDQPKSPNPKGGSGAEHDQGLEILPTQEGPSKHWPPLLCSWQEPG